MQNAEYRNLRAPGVFLSLSAQVFHKKVLMEFHNSTDLLIEWRKYLTREARTPNMAVAPASAFPPIVVPLIRMPE